MIFKKIRKGHVDWRNFLCGTPANDYIFQKDTYEYRIDRAVEYIRNADCILIGAGAGASTAAGISMGGKRFTDNFAEFIEKYGSRYMTDMYAAGFYPFPTEEAKWGYWSKAALLNRFDLPAFRQFPIPFFLCQPHRLFDTFPLRFPGIQKTAISGTKFLNRRFLFFFIQRPCLFLFHNKSLPLLFTSTINRIVLL